MTNNSDYKLKKVKNKKKKHLDKIVESDEKFQKNFKNDSTTFNLLEVIIVMIITVLFGIVIGWFIGYINNNNKSQYLNNRDDIKEIIDVYDNLVDEYYKDIDSNQLITGAINGMMNSLVDPYSIYIDPNTANLFNDELTGSFTGIGVEIVLYDDSLPVIINVLDNTPASSAGIMPNDVLYKIDGKDIQGLSIFDITSMIKNGSIGEEVKITVLRNGTEKEFILKRENIEIESVFVNYYENGDNKIAIISISKFAKNSFLQFEKIYNEVLDNNVDSLIIDVRNNSGGYLSVAKNISSLFLDKNDVIYQKKYNDNIEIIKSDIDNVIDMNVVILVNEETASSAEVFVAALKENLDIDVVGTNTYGKGTVQKIMELSDGAYIKYTVQTLCTPNGNDIDGIGIVPDFVVNLENDSDSQLNFAIELLSKGE